MSNPKPMPADAKVKKISTWGLGDEKTEVRVQERKDTWTETTRMVDVWDAKGEYLGYIESSPDHQTATRLYANVASYGVKHEAWFPAPAKDGSPMYWNNHRSQAAAIRSLINYA